MTMMMMVMMMVMVMMKMTMTIMIVMAIIITNSIVVVSKGSELEGCPFLGTRSPGLLGIKKQAPCYKAELTSVFRRMVLPHRTVCICSQGSARDGHSGSQLNKGCS